MKILIHTKGNYDQTVFLIDYLRDVYTERIQDVILVDMSWSEETRKWASCQSDFTYVYVEERLTPGKALNQVINELGIDDDVLLIESGFLPLSESIERLADVMKSREDAFAVGPVSNSFDSIQRMDWQDAEEALDWSISRKESECEESLYLFYGVILFSHSVIGIDQPFNEETEDLGNLILEKCIREFINHKKMYVCKDSGFWDIRGGEQRERIIVDEKLFDRLYGTHYLYISGNMDIIKLISKDADCTRKVNVLEIGCDCGGTLFEVKKIFRNARLYGVDINENPLRIASEFAEVKVKNIEDKNIDFGVSFDYIIFGDVLEHLRDPLSTLIYCKSLLKKGGRIVASIPNLMNISIIKSLLDGDFTYTDNGLLDRTHIHLFTYKEIIKMFRDQAKYTIEAMSMNVDCSEEDEKLIEGLLKLGTAEKYMYQAYQYQILARKDN